MTQKSLARRQRDEEKAKNAKDLADYRKNNAAWSDLDQLYQANKGLLSVVAQQVSKFFSIPDVAAFLPTDHRVSTVSAIRTLQQDVSAFAADLDKIYSNHAGRTGPLKPEEDLAKVIELSEAYIVMESQINAIVTPTYHYLLSVMERVVEKLEASAAAEAAQATPETTLAPA